MGKDITAKLDKCLPKTEGRLFHIYDAMRYSALSGGKRIRPILMSLAYEAVGGKGENIDPFLCAIEMIHTYSLIHDDLPAMDDDDFRRGMETNHIKFTEWTAILAGDALLNRAFEVMLEATVKTPKPSYIEAMHTLSIASGTRGMIGGQVIDIMSENEDVHEDTVDFIHRNKTAALMVAPVDMGAILGGATEKEKEALHKFAFNIGMAFQIADDILDVLSTQEDLGKPINSDIEKNKATYVSIHGVEKAKKQVEDLTTQGIRELAILGVKGEKLKQIALFLTSRKY
ncbi:MAG TPA: polyprenyl synthetase family protein [Epulopiscium sp.]|nr:polyprenyl synthetase family protein [Candidatus Epulonipiscium sp.]